MEGRRERVQKQRDQRAQNLPVISQSRDFVEFSEAAVYTPDVIEQNPDIVVSMYEDIEGEEEIPGTENLQEASK